MTSLWAVHILDGVLHHAVLVAGFALAVILACLGGRRLREEEIPRVAVISSAFFVASSIHVPVPGTSVHLLLNGLVGVILGPRAALSIPLGLVLQALLFGHGGLTTLGVNDCIMVLPALAAWGGFAACKHRAWFQRAAYRWLTGFAIGAGTVLLTSSLNFLVLWLGGKEYFLAPAVVAWVSHLPLAAVEGLIVAATINFLVRVKPEMLGLRMPPIPPAAPQSTELTERQAS